MNRKLYVGSLPFQTTETDLTALFASSGDVSTANVIGDRETGRPRGFAFVEMATDEGTTRSIETLNNTSYGGRNLSVNEARPTEARRESPGFDRRSRRSQAGS